MTDKLKGAQELGTQLYVDVLCSIYIYRQWIYFLLYLIHQELLVKLTLTASGWSVTSTLSKHLSDGLTAHSVHGVSLEVRSTVKGAFKELVYAKSG